MLVQEGERGAEQPCCARGPRVGSEDALEVLVTRAQSAFWGDTDTDLSVLLLAFSCTKCEQENETM